MAPYRLSEAAKADLADAYQYGLTAFGEARADAYYLALSRRFEQIAAEPRLYPAVDHIRGGYRRSICGVSAIYYRVVDGTPEIMRILGRQDTAEALR